MEHVHKLPVIMMHQTKPDMFSRYIGNILKLLFSLSAHQTNNLALFFSPNGVCLSIVRMEKLTVTNVKLLPVINLMARL